MSIEVIVSCDDCNSEADTAYCKKHFDSRTDDAFKHGKEVGYQEGYEDARKEFEKTE